MTKQEVLDRITIFSEVLQEEALRVIQTNREDYIPELLEALDHAYQNAQKMHDEDSDYFLHIYAMYL